MSARWICLELHGKGDKFFGGSADDRPLGRDGAFLTGSYSRASYGSFPSKAAALRAGERATNRRPKGLLLALPKSP